MKKIFNILTIVAGAALLLASCAKQELDTNQFPATTEVALKAYGPRPVVRGGVLRFVGMNLDQVASITIPGCDPITDIEVITSGVPSEIRITVPKEEAEVGTVILTTKDGKTIETDTPLSYIEDITLLSVEPEEAYPGETVTISGDYLNLIQEVLFTKNIYISKTDFVSQDRYAIKVVVPAEARTGKIGIGTLDQNEVTDEDILAALNVIEADFTVKTAEGTISGEYKAGTTVTVTGTKLSLVTAVKMDMVTMDIVSKTDSKLSFVLSEDAVPGEVLLVHASGVEVSAGEIEITVPAVSTVAPNPVLPGEELTLTGTDLDLVNSLEVPSVSNDNRWPGFEKSETSLSFIVPDDATGDNIVLHMVNGQTVEVEYALVEPTITNIDPEEITAGDTFIVTGTNFQLVKAVAIGSEVCEFTMDSETQLTVTSAAAAQSGKVVLTLASGKKVSSETELTVKAAGQVQVTNMPASASVGDEITLEGSGFMAIEAIYFGDTKITAYSERTDGSITFTIPVELETGNYTPRFILTTGEEELCALSIEVKGAVTTIVLFEGSHDMGTSWDGGAALYIDKSAFGKVPYGAAIHMEYECTPADYNMFQFCYNTDGWPKLGEVGITGTTSYVLTPTKEEYDQMYKYGLVIFGYAWVMNKVYITYENDSRDPVFVGDVVLVDWDDHGGHNGYWDQPDGWGGVGTELLDDGNGGLYLHIITGSEDQKWTVCCNHQSSFTTNVPSWVIDDASKYVLKMDICLEGDASAADMTFNPVLGDQWPGGKDAGLFPATTGGKWVTVAIDLGLSGTWDCSSGTNGFMAGNVPSGMCLDNFRFSLK